MKKGKVAAQFVMELFIVTIISMIVGTTAGAMCSSPIADKLLEAQISSQQTQTEQRMENFGKPDSMNGNMQATPPSGDDGMNMGSGKGGMFAQFGGQVANYVSEINAATDLAVVMQLLGIGILLTILSSCIAVIFILRYEPLKILANRS